MKNDDAKRPKWEKIKKSKAFALSLAVAMVISSPLGLAGCRDQYEDDDDQQQTGSGGAVIHSSGGHSYGGSGAGWSTSHSSSGYSGSHGGGFSS